MKNKLNIIITLIIMLVLAGCAGTSRPRPINIHVGTDGLSVKFLPGSPPDEAYINDYFSVILEMNNEGAFDITRGILALGVEREYVDVLTQEYNQKTVSFDLNGRSEYDPLGGRDRREINLRVRGLGPQSETHTTIIAATTCYPYKTEATAEVCIDADILGQRQSEKVCEPITLSMGTHSADGQELPNGQGAPIAITKIEQKMLQHEKPEFLKPQFMIYVRNMGDGLPVSIDSYETACESIGLGKGALNVITATVFLSDRSVQLNCNPKLISNSTDKRGYLKLEKQEDFIKCTLDEGMPKTYGTFNTPLMIELDYGYTETISKNILLRKQV